MTVYGLQVEWAVGNDAGPNALGKLTVAFERAGAAVADFGKYVFPKLTPVFEAAEAAQFDAEGAGLTGAWAALRPSYEEWKSYNFPGLPILQLKGELRAALTSSTSPLAYREWSASEFAFGTVGVEYASFHQTGTRGNTRGEGMPARPPFDFGPSFEEALTRAAMRGLREAIGVGTGHALEFEGEP